ncbi:MAG: hypothetical protein J6Y79_01720 [Paludibacteraceae bacterium]|nr:hypothetical protein [Paludibacteraceae bacterium]
MDRYCKKALKRFSLVAAISFAVLVTSCALLPYNVPYIVNLLLIYIPLVVFLGCLALIFLIVASDPPRWL